MNLSVASPVGSALTRTGRILFKPFNIGKWFTIGFCAWLAHMGEGPSPPDFSGSLGPNPAMFSRLEAWIRQNQDLAIMLGVGIVLLFLALGLVLMWIASRARFMFLDNLVLNRGAVVEPWEKFRVQGNSLFKFQLVYTPILLVCFFLVIGISVLIALPDIEAGKFEGAATTGLLVGLLLFFGWGIIFGVITLILMDFVVPAMYRFDETVVPAWRRVRAEVLSGRFWTIVLYVLMKFVLGIAIAMIMGIMGCLTCYLAALPYLGAVILLPLFVFVRCYSVCFLEQLGGKWAFFPPPEPPPAPPVAPPPPPPSAAGGPSAPPPLPEV